MRRAKLATLGVMLLAGAGCGFSDSLAIGGVQEQCVETSECAGAQICQNGACVPETPNSTLGNLSVEIRPQPGSLYALAQFQNVSFAAGRQAFELPETARYEVVNVLDEQMQPLPARILIFGQDTIPGRELIAQYSRTPINVLRIAPGTYTTRVIPTDPGIPGIDVRWSVEGPLEFMRRDFTLIRGARQLAGSVSLRTMEQTKVAGVTVQALATGSSLPSSVTVTQEDGSYRLDLPDTQETGFRLIARREGATSPAWGYERLVTVPLGETRETVDIRLEPTPTEAVGRARIQLFGLGEDSKGPVRLAGARVALSARSELDTPMFRAELTSDADGLVSVDGSETIGVIAATYDIEIDPVAGSPFAFTSTTIDLTRVTPINVGDKQLVVGRRTTVTGVVTQAEGQPIRGAQLEFELLDRETRPTLATSNDFGEFDVFLDPGQYLLRVDGGRSTEGASFQVAYRLVTIPVGAKDIDLESSIALPSATVAQGTVIGALTGQSIPSAEVEFWLRIAGRTVSLGRTQADAEGRFQAILPDLESQSPEL